MKLLFIVLLFPLNVFALDLTLGIGYCDSALDYCPKPVAKIAVGHDFWINGKHTIRVEAEHLSKASDLIGGDRGTELYFLEYKYTFFK